MNCQHCRTELYPEDLATAPLCDLCHAANVQQQIRAAAIDASEQYKDSQAYRASALRKRIHDEAEAARAELAAQGISWINGKPLPHAEVTPAGLNYLLPGVEPIHTTPPTEGQARLL